MDITGGQHIELNVTCNFLDVLLVSYARPFLLCVGAISDPFRLSLIPAIVLDGGMSIYLIVRVATLYSLHGSTCTLNEGGKEWFSPVFVLLTFCVCWLEFVFWLRLRRAGRKAILKGEVKLLLDSPVNVIHSQVERSNGRSASIASASLLSAGFATPPEENDIEGGYHRLSPDAVSRLLQGRLSEERESILRRSEARTAKEEVTAVEVQDNQSRPLVVEVDEDEEKKMEGASEQDNIEAGIAALPSHLQEYARGIIAEVQADSGHGGEGWKQFHEEHNVKLYKKKRASGQQASKGVGIIRASAEKIFELVSNIERRHEYDDMFNKGESLEAYSDFSTLGRACFHRQWPVAAREMITLTIKGRRRDGVHMLGLGSVDRTDIACEPKHVRAYIYSSGFHIRPLPDGSGCEVTNITCVDLGGSIPQGIVNMVMKKQPMIVHKLRAFVE